MERAGFVLVGGKSSRMGQDKALLPYGGATLIQHIAAQVVAAAGQVALVGPPERYGFLGFPVIADSVPDFGPVAGIHAALQAPNSTWNLIVACDMPGVTAEFLRGMLDAAEQCGPGCLVPRGPSGRLQPLCAVYHRTCFAGIDQAIHANIRKVRDAIAGLRVHEWPVADDGWFRNLNTPEDLASHA
jgi:molybdopterin-guanine dinucleotide biosynthesis protein A